MAISGIYQMEDDGVINPDNVSLVPGTVIPKSPGSAGLQPIATAGRFDVADLVLNDMRKKGRDIRMALVSSLVMLHPCPDSSKDSYFDGLTISEKSRKNNIESESSR